MKKKFFLFLILLLFSVKVEALDIVKPTNDFYVNDYANLLSDETKSYIQEHSVNLYNKSGIQIVVVTVKDMGGASIEEYSLEVARSFGIGSKDKDNGLLIILSEQERDIRIEVGYGLEEVINDAKAGRLIDDYMISFLKENNYSEGILNGYKAVYKELVDHYNLDMEVDEPAKEEVDDLIGIVAMILAGKMIYTIILFGIDLDTKKLKIVNFLILETLTIIITIGSYFTSADIGASLFLVFGTIANILAVLIYVESSGGYYGGGSSGHYHSSGHSSGGHHGGGGHFGGGGASRHF